MWFTPNEDSVMSVLSCCRQEQEKEQQTQLMTVRSMVHGSPALNFDQTVIYTLLSVAGTVSGHTLKKTLLSKQST